MSTAAAAVPGFLSKTFEIFNTPIYGEMCGWGNNRNSNGGETIVVLKVRREHE
jgi:hypothetical protein